MLFTIIPIDPEKKTFYWSNEYEIEIYEAALSDNRVYVWRQDCFFYIIVKYKNL